MRQFPFRKIPKKNKLFWGILPKTCFLSADTYTDHGVSPIAEGVEFLPFFGLGRRKNNDILGIYFVRNNCVFSDAPELVQNKIPKKSYFFGEFSRRHVSFPRILILIMASYPSRRGSNFCRFLASDVEKITIFWESTLCEIIAFFRMHQSLCKTKFQKKLLFWGIFPDVFFIMFPFPGYVFTLCFLGGPRRLVGRDVFSRETIRCFLAQALSLRRRITYFSANRFEPRISRDQHIQPCQPKTTDVKIHPAVPKVHTHLISFGQMEMANANGNFGNALVGLRAWNDATHNFRRSVRKNREKKRFFGRLKKCCFFRATAPG